MLEHVQDYRGVPYYASPLFKLGTEAEISNTFAPEPNLLYPYEQISYSITDFGIVLSRHDTFVLHPKFSNGKIMFYMLIFSSHFIAVTEVPPLPLLRLALLTLTACSAVVPRRPVLMGGRFTLDWGRAKGALPNCV